MTGEFQLNLPAWMSEGACAGHPEPDLWFPDKGGFKDTQRARMICDSCTVRADCLRYAVDEMITHGMWGGLAPKERRHLQQPRRRVA